MLIGLLVAKSLMWAFSLGSGTSGGVLAPLLMIGGALGELMAVLVHAPVQAQSLWALVGMGAMLSGALGVPLTAIVFSLELTHCLPTLLPLMAVCIAAHALIIVPRSILSEKLNRRGYHLTREYGVDPLEMVSVMARGGSIHEAHLRQRNRTRSSGRPSQVGPARAGSSAGLRSTALTSRTRDFPNGHRFDKISG